MKGHNLIIVTIIIIVNPLQSHPNSPFLAIKFSRIVDHYLVFMKNLIRSRVVVAQWLEHWWLKPVALGSNPGRQLRFSHIFTLFFFQTPLGEKVSI